MLVNNKPIRLGDDPVEYAVYTHIGKRKQNQDRTLVWPDKSPSNPAGRLFAIADGMGGHSGGCLASRLACDGLAFDVESVLSEAAKSSPIGIARHLTESILRIDRSIRLKGLKDCKVADMGTTLSCLVITHTHSIIAHVGDTRIYRLRNGFLSLLTTDHTFVQDMIFEGEVDPKNASSHPLRHVLTRAVGTGEPLPLVDCRIDLLKKRDRFLLCSDGLTNTLSKRTILDILLGHPRASATAKELVTRAFNEEAKDNVTVIVVGKSVPDIVTKAKSNR